jgi:hypothetical protein
LHTLTTRHRASSKSVAIKAQAQARPKHHVYDGTHQSRCKRVPCF